MLKYRFITAIFGVVLLFLLFVWANPFILYSSFFIGLALLQYEFSKMFFPAFLGKLNIYKQERFKWYCIISVFWSSLFALIVCISIGSDASFYLTSIFVVMIMIISLLTEKTIEIALLCSIGYILSLCYITIPWLAIREVYLQGDQGKYLILLLVIVMLSDTGAYVCGRAFGQIKLASHLSPNKTFEGALGGLCCCIFGALVLDYCFDSLFQSRGYLVLVSVVCSIAGIFGDLVESLFKRFANVKDSGKLLPGHGGLLDRFDSLLFAAPVLLFFIYCYQGSF